MVDKILDKFEFSKQRFDDYDDLILHVLKKTNDHSVSFDTILILTGMNKCSLWKRLTTLRKYGIIRQVKVAKTSFWKINGGSHE